jgi:hypothetical protein
MNLARSAARHVLVTVDRLYRRWHRLTPSGPLLFAGRTRYRGPTRRFADGTVLESGAPLGTLHFHNARIAALNGATPSATGLQFRRLLFASLHALAELSHHHPAFRDVAVYRGVGWVRHGEQLGFLHEPAPAGWRNRWVAAHVRLLVRVFAAPGGTALDARTPLTITWLTRRALLERFGARRRG